VSRAGPRWPPLGVIPREDSVEALEDGGYVAKVSLVRMADGAVISSASSECGMDEPTWAGRARYARRSMAVTRATGKAARLAFSWSWRWPDSKRRPPRKCLQIAMSPRMRTRCRLANIGARNGQISEMTISVGLSRRTKPLPLSRWALRRNSTVVSLSMTRASRTNMARLHLKRVLTGFVPADEPSLTLLRKYKVGEVYRADVVKPRSYQHHKLIMALLNLTYENLPRSTRDRMPVSISSATPWPWHPGTANRMSALRARSARCPKA